MIDPSHYVHVLLLTTSHCPYVRLWNFPRLCIQTLVIISTNEVPLLDSKAFMVRLQEEPRPSGAGVRYGLFIQSRSAVC